MLVRLLYASRTPKEIDNSVIESIISQSKAHNPGAGVTGILCYSGKIFMQVLEGNRREVTKLYNQIAADSRHSDVEILLFEDIVERRFSNWTMGQVNLAKVNPSTLLKYSEKPVLDPFTLGGKVSMALLEELMATAAIVAKV
jgi:Sensors of blue-light using FAD